MAETPADINSDKRESEPLPAGKEILVSEQAIKGAQGQPGDDDPKVLIHRAYGYFNQRQYRGAVEVCDRILMQDPRNEDAHVWKIQSLRSEKDFAGADKAIEEAQTHLADDRPRILMQRAYWYSDQQQYKEAADAFERVLEKEPDNEDAHLCKIESLRFEKDFAGADKAIEEAQTHLTPDRPKILLQRAYWHSDQQQYGKAVEVCDRILSKDSGNEDAHVCKIQSLRFEKDFAGADKAIKEAQTHLTPDRPRILMQRAYWHSNQQQYGKTVEVCDRILKKDSGNEDAHVCKIESLRFEKDFAGADKAIKEAQTHLTDDRPKILLQRAYWYSDQQRYGKAVEVCDTILNRDSGNEDAHVWKIQSLRFEKDFAGADKAIKEAQTHLTPDRPKILMQRAYWHSNQQQYGKTVEVCDRILKKDSGNEDAHVCKIESLRFEKDFAGADKAIKEAQTHLTDDRPKILLQRAYWHSDQQQYGKAVEVCDRILKKDSGNEDAHLCKIDSLRLEKDFAGADKAIKEAQTHLTPDRPKILMQRAYWHSDQQQFKEAVEVCDRILSKDSGNEDAHVWKIQSLRFERHFAGADKAIKEARQQLDDDRPSILLQRAFWHYDQQQFQDAVEGFDKVLKADRKNEDALVWRIITLRADKQPDDSDQKIKDAAADQAIKDAQDQLGDGNPRVQLQRAGWYYGQDKYQEALKTVEAASRVSPDDIYLKFAQVDALEALNRDREALGVLEKLKAVFPKKIDVLANLGWFHLRQHDYVNARKEFESIHSMDPSNAAGMCGLGGVHFYQGRFGDAAKQFRKAIEIEPSNPVWHANLAWALVRQEPKTAPRKAARAGFCRHFSKEPDRKPETELDQAEKECNKALSLDRLQTAAYGCLGRIAFKRGRLRDAEDYFKTSIWTDRKKGSYTDLGALYVQMGKNDEAKDELSKALKNDESDVDAHIEMANFYLQTDQTKKAVQECRQAASYDPCNGAALRALAIALMHDGEFPEAEKVLRDALRTLDKDSLDPIHLALSQLLIRWADKTGDDAYYDGADAEILEALRRNPALADAHLQRGFIRYKRGDYKDAVKSFEACLGTNPDNLEAQRFRDRIESFIKESGRNDPRKSIAGHCLSVISLALLAALWVGYFWPVAQKAPAPPPVPAPVVVTSPASPKAASEIADAIVKAGSVATNTVPAATDTGAPPARVSGPVITILTPLLLGAIIIGLLLPRLTKLELTGFKAELAQPKEDPKLNPPKMAISDGPTGSLSGLGSPSAK